MLRVGMEADMTRNQRTGRGVAGKPGRRYELTDEAYARIEPLLPKQTRGGRWNDHRVTLNGIFWILNAGAQWRDLPERYGKWNSVWRRYDRWCASGVWEALAEVLGEPDLEELHLDSTVVKAHQSSAGSRRQAGEKKTPPTSGAAWADRAGD